ncbi:MAG: hypothetical protein GY772_13725 [bacterium]|nr:hypothetical protein [bacterium]
MKNFYITETVTVGEAEIEVETEIEVEYAIEPAQHGGREDPSWPAHATLDRATRAEDLVVEGVTLARKGARVELDPAAREDIEREMMEYSVEP